MSRARAAALLVLILSLAGIASAQQSVCLQRTIPITVLNKKNDQVVDATRLSFQASYRGQPISVTSVTASERAPRVAILFDLSDSVTSSSPYIPNVNLDLTRAHSKTAILPSSIQTGFVVLDRLLADLPPTTEVSLAVFASKMEVLAGPTSNRQEVTDAVHSLSQNLDDVRKRIGRSTALWDAIDQSRKLLSNPQPGDAIFVLSDAGDNLSKEQLKPVVTAVGASGVRLFFTPLQIFQMNIGWRVNFWQMGALRAAQVQTSALAEAVDATGGWTFGAKAGRTTDKELTAQSRIVQVAHRLTIALPEAVDQPEDWTLDITNVAPAVRKDLELIYPRKLMPCL